MTEIDIKSKFKNIFESYLEFKPMLFYLHRSNDGKHSIAVLNEIRAMNDHLARCYIKPITPIKQYEELSKAEGHLKRAIYDCFKQLNLIFYNDMERIENSDFGSHWLTLSDGDFWVKYSNLRKEITEEIRIAKAQESLDSPEAFKRYQAANAYQNEIYDLISQNKGSLSIGWKKRLYTKISEEKSWIIGTIGLTIISALVCELIF